MMLGNRVPSLRHLDRMTDSTGLIQHGIYSLPRRESGYTTDDHARALRLAARIWELQPNEVNLSRVICYLSFLEHARSPVRGFHNFMGYQRDWLDSGGTDDCQGQVILALAEVLASELPIGIRALAMEMVEGAIASLSQLRSIRAQAYVIQAWMLLKQHEIVAPEKLGAIAKAAAIDISECYGRSRRLDWHWFESRMTYANAVLPHAMFDAAVLWPEKDFLSIAQESFAFLDSVCTSAGIFWPVGNHDWYSHGEDKSLYDQQPVEASTMAAAAVAAFECTKQTKYLTIFDRAYDWFLGKNSLDLPMVNLQDGGCFDGLMSDGVNRNQGAESTLALLWTQLLKNDLQTTSRNSRHIKSAGV